MTLTIIEFSVLLTCAVILGIVIHFFIISRRNLQTSPFAIEKLKKTVDEWKLKYFNEVEKKDHELDELKKQFNEINDNYEIYKLEAEELRSQQQKYESESEIKTKETPTQADYIAQLLEARTSLMEHSRKVEKLMENIEEVKENDEKQKLLEEENELLAKQVKDMKEVVDQKDDEINKLVNNQSVKMEMSSMLDNAYTEFNNLQSKIQKLESQLSASKLAQIEYEGLHENYYKIHSENEEYRSRLQTLTVENQQMTLKLYESEDKLREANFQRQQLQKRVSYLEELTRDLQMVTDANKKLEHQLRRIGELESMLNVVSEERDELLKKGGPNK